MILKGSKTYLDLRKTNNDGILLEKISSQMIRTHLEVRMANDGLLRIEMTYKMDF